MNKCICDKCGAEFDITPRQRSDGDLDIIYFVCPHCNEEYLVSVTDSVLRDHIAEYGKLMGKLRTVADPETSDKLLIKAHEMKQANHQRSRELMAAAKDGNTADRDKP